MKIKVPESEKVWMSSEEKDKLEKNKGKRIELTKWIKNK